jgi:hypothetical protein
MQSAVPRGPPHNSAKSNHATPFVAYRDATDRQRV